MSKTDCQHGYPLSVCPICTAVGVPDPRDATIAALTQLRKIRDALIANDVYEAYHQLYALADPTFTVPNAVSKLLGEPDDARIEAIIAARATAPDNEPGMREALLLADERAKETP